jgi:hypothetical protein
MEGKSEYTETVSSVAKAPGVPGARTLRGYCDMGLLPYVLDANGRRLLRSDAKVIAARVYAERLRRRGKSRKAR